MVPFMSTTTPAPAPTAPPRAGGAPQEGIAATAAFVLLASLAAVAFALTVSPYIP